MKERLFRLRVWRDVLDPPLAHSPKGSTQTPAPTAAGQALSKYEAAWQVCLLRGFCPSIPEALAKLWSY